MNKDYFAVSTESYIGFVSGKKLKKLLKLRKKKIEDLSMLTKEELKEVKTTKRPIHGFIGTKKVYKLTSTIGLAHLNFKRADKIMKELGLTYEIYYDNESEYIPNVSYIPILLKPDKLNDVGQWYLAIAPYENLLGWD